MADPFNLEAEDAVEVRVRGGAEAGRRFLERLEQLADVEIVSGPHPNRRGPGVRYYAKVQMRQFNQANVERDWLLAEAPDELRERFFAIQGSHDVPDITG